MVRLKQPIAPPPELTLKEQRERDLSDRRTREFAPVALGLMLRGTAKRKARLKEFKAAA